MWKKWVSIIAPLIIMGLILHVVYAPKLPVIIIYGSDSVEVEAEGLSLHNNPIMLNGLPGVMAYYEGLMIIAFVNADSYWQAKQGNWITEVTDEGVTINVLSAYVTAGDYLVQPYQIIGNKEHPTDNEGQGKQLVIFNNDNPLYRKLRFNILI